MAHLGSFAREPPSQIKFGDGDTDDNNNGQTGENDEFDTPAPVCNGEPFDFIVTAYGANPKVDPFTITLDGQPVGTDLPKAGVVVSNLSGDRASNINPQLRDSFGKVEFPVGCLTLADNGEILKACDMPSGVCSELILDVVDSPDDPLQLTVSDPFAPRNPTQDNPRDLAGVSNIRLHLDTSYLFTCNAEGARPYAELTYDLSPPGDSLINPTASQPTPDPLTASSTQLFASQSTVRFEDDDFSSSGADLCCRAKNIATVIGCDPSPVEHCVTIEVIDEPSDLKMEMRMQQSGDFVDVGEEYTDLQENEQFDFRCIASESAPAADIKWTFTPRAVGSAFNLIGDADAPLVDSQDSDTSPLDGHLDTTSTITFEATNEVLGGTLRCCAEHVAIPGGTGDAEGNVYDEDPSLTPLCVETVLRFPVAPNRIEIWDRGNGQSRYVYEEGELVYLNIGDDINNVLNCTSYESRPYTYIGWSGDDLGNNAPERENKFISSDCPFFHVTSDTGNTDPLTMTYDTTKCVILEPIEFDHGRKVYCTATNIANTVGISTCVEIYLCIPCSENLELKDVTPSGNIIGTGYTDGSMVTLLRNGQERTLSCINSYARNQPSLDIWLVLANGDILQENELDTELKYVEPLSDGAWEYRKDVTLSLGGEYDIDGATLICECANNGDESSCAPSEASISVTLTAFDQPPVNANTAMGTGNQATFEDIGGDEDDAEVILVADQEFTGAESDRFAPPNFSPADDIIEAISNPWVDRRKREIEGECGANQLTCYTLGTKPAVDFIWKLDDQVLSGDFINSYSVDSQLNLGPSQGLVDSYSTITFDPVYRGLHSRELCCELSSSDIGSPIRRCADLIVFSKPNSPLELSGTNVVNEGQTVQLRCLATEHYPAGVFQWEDSDGSSLPRDEAQTPTQLQQLPNFRLEQFSDYSFVASREHNGKEITCTLEQDFDNFDCDYDESTSGEIELSVNFCPTTNAVINGCPSAPVSPGRAVTLSCQSAVSNPALRLDWYLNNVAQSQTGASTTQARDYGYVTIQTFTTRQLGLADDGLQLQCCPTHLTPNIGCGQLCSSVCTLRVEPPPPDVGCRWIRVELTLENIDGNAAVWDSDYANEQSAAYRALTDGLRDVFRQVFDGLPYYRSAVLPTIRESGDGLVQVVVGLEFDSPYGTTTDDVNQGLADATNANGYIVTDGGNVTPYDILPNSATAVCVCPSGFCVRGPDCRPSTDDFSSSCECPPTYLPPRCDVFQPPVGPTQGPPTGTGVKYGRLSFILEEIDDVPAVWDDKYNDLTDPETVALISGIDGVLTDIFGPAFSNCFQNVRIADLFEAQGGGIGVVAGVEFVSRECGVSEEDIRSEFFANVDNDQKIGGSIYELDEDYLQETNVEEVCGNDFSCSNGGYCEPSDTVYYSSCRCLPGYSGSRCQDLIPVPATDPPGPPPKDDPKGLSTEALIGIIIGVVLFAAILLGLCLLCCFLLAETMSVSHYDMSTQMMMSLHQGEVTLLRQKAMVHIHVVRSLMMIGHGVVMGALQ
ncbi:uncharacterized protein [Amphiura filiformis]|uniref:uncharacterized protein n=1 Tax=Amphiura filiformis TaxID=82378 RepID=UPI003B21854A